MNQANNELAERYAEFRITAIEKRALELKQFVLPKLDEAAKDCKCFLEFKGNDLPPKFALFKHYQDARDILEKCMDGVKVERTESPFLFGAGCIVGLRFTWFTGKENPRPDEPEMRKEDSVAQHIKIEGMKIDSNESIKKIAAQLADFVDHTQGRGRA